MSAYPYAKILGFLLYLVVAYTLTSRILLVFSQLICRTYAACKAASCVLNYLSQHPAVCIGYSCSRLDLHVYTDLEWGSDKDTRATIGILILMAAGSRSFSRSLLCPLWRLNILSTSMLSRISSRPVSCLRTSTWSAQDQLRCSSTISFL